MAGDRAARRGAVAIVDDASGHRGGDGDDDEGAEREAAGHVGPVGLNSGDTEARLVGGFGAKSATGGAFPLRSRARARPEPAHARCPTVATTPSRRR
ncbi:MAG: hypothetical protein ACRD0G_04465 [Acidimicrobiales bacterium]